MMTPNQLKRPLLAMLLGSVLAACSQSEEPAANQAVTSASIPVASSAPNNQQQATTYPIPHIPPILVPDFLGATQSQLAFETALPARLKPSNGIRVYPARCDQQQLINRDGSIMQHSGNQATQINQQGVLSVQQDGSGFASDGRVTVNANADGSGNAVVDLGDGNALTVTVKADGSGSYIGPEGTMTIDGKGGGTWVGEQGTISIHADGSGSWVGDQGVIEIKADGSGTWTGGQLQTNLGNGKGSVGAEEQAVAMAPWPLPPRVGKMPLLNTFAMPGKVCGYIISLDDQVLFDFDQATLRPDANAILDELGTALQQVATQDIEIRGHTDSKGSDSYNQTLSENRAQAVLKALQQRVQLANTHAKGYGESQPVAPNDTNGQDAPANRQLNRRVEIFVRTV